MPINRGNRILFPTVNPDKIACPGEGKYFIIVPLKKENPLCISSLGEGVLCSCASDTQLLQTCSFRGKDLVIKKKKKRVWLNDRAVLFNEAGLISGTLLHNPGLTPW